MEGRRAAREVGSWGAASALANRCTEGGLTVEEISTASLQYVLVDISAEAAGAAVNPTSDTVQMAFLTSDSAPSVGDWKTASWETDAGTDPDTYSARCLVGTGGAVALSAGTYNVWVKISDSPETPVLRAKDYLRVV